MKREEKGMRYDGYTIRGHCDLLIQPLFMISTRINPVEYTRKLSIIRAGVLVSVCMC